VCDDEGYWRQVDVYIRQRTDVDFSHSVCPECVKKNYPDFHPRPDEVVQLGSIFCRPQFSCRARNGRPFPNLHFIAPAIKYPKIVIPAEAGISSRTVGVCHKIPGCAGMTVVCLFRCQINISHEKKKWARKKSIWCLVGLAQARSDRHAMQKKCKTGLELFYFCLNCLSGRIF